MSSSSDLRALPQMRDFKRNKVTVAQIDDFENGTANHLRAGSPAFTADFRRLLDGRRKRLVAKDRENILCAIQEHQVVVVTSPTGSGKTTEIPQLVMFNELESCKLVACTQPRRLAARSVAEFVAKQRDVSLGEEVGYKVRFDNKTTRNKTRLLYMTDGMLVQELKLDAALSKYGCIIIDEAHERSLATDTLLPFLKRALKNNADLKVVVMSATIEAMKFRQYFAQPDGSPAPFLEIGGFSYPVVNYNLETVGTDSSFIDDAVDTVVMIHSTKGPGDILVFLPGVDEISTAASELQARVPEGLQIIPVHSTLSEEEQKKVFGTTLDGIRKVALATNIAETSLTIDGIKYVIDTGLVKQPTWNPRFGGESLKTQCISRASAVQRSGRGGRTQAGECWRLYTVRHFQESMVMSTIPQIKRSDLAPLVLTIMTMGCSSVKDVLEFDFLDKPDPEQFMRAFEDLFWMGFISRQGRLADNSAAHAAAFPVYPAWYRAINHGERLGCSGQMVTLAAILSTQASIFNRPQVAWYAADKVHQQFRHPLSDHITYLNAYHAYHQAEAEGLNMSEWCYDNFINSRAAREAAKVRQRLVDICMAKGIQLYETTFRRVEDGDNFRKALAYGFLHRTAILTDPKNDVYMSCHGQMSSALLDPSSCLVYDENQEPKELHPIAGQCIVYDKLHQGAAWYFQTATLIELDWMLDLEYFQPENIPDFHERRMEPIKVAVSRALRRRGVD